MKVRVGGYTVYLATASSTMRFEVPQFIDVEDKIFGPFTWRQFVYLAGAGGAAIVLYIFLPFFLFLLIAGPIAALAAGLAFFPINNRPLSYFLEAMFSYVSSTRLYLWNKEKEPTTTPTAAEATPLYTPPQTNNIASLSRKLELNALKKGDQ